MSDPTVLLSLLGLFSTVVAAVFASATWAQKTLVQVLEKQIISLQEEKKLISADNREQAQTIMKLGVSVDKLTEQGGQTIRLLEDVVYGRETAANPRRHT
jgi:hypothetical protein